MTDSEARAAVFVRAIKSLKGSERAAVLAGIVDDRSLRRDILDLATIAERRKEPSRPLREYLAECGR